MRLLRDPIGTFTFAWALVACSSFDPNRLVPTPPSSAEAGAAGWSYEAGESESQAGRAPSGSRNGSTPLGSAGSLGAGGRWSGIDDAGGAPNADDAGGAAGTRDEPSDSGAGAAAGGITARGGVSGGGASGRSGNGPIGGKSGAGGRGSAGKAGAGAPGGRAGSAGTNTGGSAGRGAAGASTTAGVGGIGGAGAPNGGSANGGAGGSSGSGNGSDRSGLMFSEYVEGSGSYKALELRGVPATALIGCQLATYSNGSSSPNTLALDGSIGASGVYVLCSSALANAGAACDRSTNLSFNGNDAVALVCDGMSLDVIGQIGFDPGTAWTGVDTSTANQTLRRRCGVNVGDADGTDAFDPALEWAALPADTFDGLGDPTCG